MAYETGRRIVGMVIEDLTPSRLLTRAAFDEDGYYKMGDALKPLDPGDFSAGFVKALGAIEVLGAVGLILPALLDIRPVLVPLAALGLAVIMTGAAVPDGADAVCMIEFTRPGAHPGEPAWGRYAVVDPGYGQGLRAESVEH